MRSYNMPAIIVGNWSLISVEKTLGAGVECTPQNDLTREMGAGVFVHHLPSVFGRGCSSEALVAGHLQRATKAGKAGFIAAGSSPAKQCRRRQLLSRPARSNVIRARDYGQSPYSPRWRSI